MPLTLRTLQTRSSLIGPAILFYKAIGFCLDCCTISLCFYCAEVCQLVSLCGDAVFTMLSARRGWGRGWGVGGGGGAQPSQHEDNVAVPFFSVLGSIVLGLPNVVGRQKPTLLGAGRACPCAHCDTAAAPFDMVLGRLVP